MNAVRILRYGCKRLAQVLAIAGSLPFALVAGFGRYAAGFYACAQLLALVPGLLGDYLRISYYWLTLQKCSLNSRVSFGSFFAQSWSTVGEGVYIGCYCVIGACAIGERSQIASHVQVLSGKHQHSRNSRGEIAGAVESEFEPVHIGADCWIGASAIIMADVGEGSTIGAGAVVTKPMPCGVTAVGNPARVLQRTGEPG
jgi:virginiamycin A acetyltransferase